MKMIEGWCRNWWRYWSVKIQLFCAALTGWLWFDPASLLSVFNMMPAHFRGLVPASALSVIGGVIFALNIATILARNVHQPKLENKDAAP